MLKAQRHAYRYKHICILSIRELYLNVYKETMYGFLCIMDEWIDSSISVVLQDVLVFVPGAL